MAIVFCGITMKQYVEANISQKSHTTVKYFLKMMSNAAETIIFALLGLSALDVHHHAWNGRERAGGRRLKRESTVVLLTLSQKVFMYH